MSLSDYREGFQEGKSAAEPGWGTFLFNVIAVVILMNLAQNVREKSVREEYAGMTCTASVSKVDKIEPMSVRVR